jgi:hypothetical protein
MGEFDRNILAVALKIMGGLRIPLKAIHGELSTGGRIIGFSCAAYNGY